MSASDCEECYKGIQLAFDLAEKFQTPVIFLSDLFLGQRLESLKLKENINYNRSTRIKPDKNDLEDYKRYKITDTGISPLIIPGEDGALYTMTGLEHNEKGLPNYEEENHSKMTAKRFRKFENMKKIIPKAEIIGDDDAKIGISSWGSTIGAIIEGMEIAKRKGVKSKLIKSIMIFPQDEETYKDFFSKCKKILIPEMNYQGQYAKYLRSIYNIDPIELHIPSVNPINPGYIAKKIMEINDELKGDL